MKGVPTEDLVLAFQAHETRKFTEASDRLNPDTAGDRDSGVGGLGAIA